MSMLAERKRKSKWIIHPPKKPLWDSDAEGINFGKELMEKMGWCPGRGLGVNEQGIIEPLKVSHKVDTKGVGYKENEENWTKQQDEFDQLLSLLTNSLKPIESSEELSKTEIKSLEEKSKKSRARVHYQKFTRGKDLSRYNENDLACILGTSKLIKQNKMDEKIEFEKNKSKKSNENSCGFRTINSGSLDDYFKKKWLNKNKNTNTNDVENKLQLKDQYSTELLVTETSLVTSQDCINLKKDNKENNELLQSSKNGLAHFGKCESVEKESCDKYLFKKKKKKDKEFSEKVKRNKKNKFEDKPSDEFKKSNKINLNFLNNLSEENSNVESDINFCKIRNETNKKRYKKEKKKKKLKKNETSFKNMEKSSDSTASEFNNCSDSDNNLKEKHLNKLKKHKRKAKETTVFEAEEDKNLEEKKFKKLKIYDGDVNKKSLDNKTLELEHNKKSKIKNKTNFELENICDKNKENLEFNSEEISIIKKIKKSKKKKAKRETENEKVDYKNFECMITKNEKLNLSSVIKSKKRSHEDSKLLETDKNVIILYKKSDVPGKSKVINKEFEFKDIVEKNENEFHNNDYKLKPLPYSNNKIMYSTHTKNKKLKYNKIIKLMYGANIDKFVGSNLIRLPGYGMRSKN